MISLILSVCKLIFYKLLQIYLLVAVYLFLLEKYPSEYKGHFPEKGLVGEK